MANDEVVELIERVKAAQAEYEGKYQQLVKVWQRQTEMIKSPNCGVNVKHPQPPEWQRRARQLLARMSNSVGKQDDGITCCKEKGATDDEKISSNIFTSYILGIRNSDMGCCPNDVS